MRQERKPRSDHRRADDRRHSIVADEGDGTDRVTVRLKDPLGSEPLILLRVSVTLGGPGPEGGLFASWMAARGETDPLAVKEGEALNNLLTYGFGVDEARQAIAEAGASFDSYLTQIHAVALSRAAKGAFAQ